jgi:MFS family permease
MFTKLPVRGRILGLLALGSLLIGLDRASLAPSVEGLRTALHVPSPALDISFAAYGFGFCLALALAGLLVERQGATRVLWGCCVLAAVAMLATAATIHVIGLALSRLVLGIAAGGFLPAATVLLAQWIPQQDRGTAQGLVHGAYWLGPILAGSLIGSADWLVSWRAAFVVLAALGAGWAALWFGFGTVRQTPPGTLPVYWRGHIRRFLLPLGLAFAQSWTIALVIQWVPAYQLETWHLSLDGSSLLTLVIAAAAAGGVLAGGFASDWVLRDSGNIRPARQLLPAVGFLGAAVGIFAMPGQHETPTIILSSGVTLFFLTLATAPLWSLALDISLEHPAIGTLFLGLGVALAQLVGPLSLARMTGAWWLGPTVGLPLLLAAGIGAFQLCPDLGIPEPPPPPVAAEEGDAADKPAGKKR